MNAAPAEIRADAEPHYLFVLNPAYCGSTAFAKFLLTSDSAFALRPNAEGQFLPAVRDLFRTEPWNTDKIIPWAEVKQIWLDCWRARQRKKPSAHILLEKSPTHLPRGAELRDVFPGARYIALMRNPYAWCASYHRHLNSGYGAAAAIWLQRARYQRWNVEHLAPILRVSYEEFVADPELTKLRIAEFLPALGDMKTDVQMQVKKYDLAGITDHNTRQIANVPAEGVSEIRNVLAAEPETLRFFGYDVEPPDAGSGEVKP